MRKFHGAQYSWITVYVGKDSEICGTTDRWYMYEGDYKGTTAQILIKRMKEMTEIVYIYEGGYKRETT